MSRIGKQPITVPSGVEVNINGQQISVKGPKGELTHTVPENIEIKQEENSLIVTPKDQERKTRGFWGLTRTLLENMITGVSQGYKKRLEINGVGYRFNVQGNTVKLELGFSNPIEYPIPEGITIAADEKKKNIMEISGIDKQKVGQVAAEIRKFRPPEPYKGKGVKYAEEQIRRKAGKAAASGGSA